jgi:hypothetical protein
MKQKASRRVYPGAYSGNSCKPKRRDKPGGSLAVFHDAASFG